MGFFKKLFKSKKKTQIDKATEDLPLFIDPRDQVEPEPKIKEVEVDGQKSFQKIKEPEQPIKEKTDEILKPEPRKNIPKTDPIIKAFFSKINPKLKRFLEDQFIVTQEIAQIMELININSDKKEFTYNSPTNFENFFRKMLLEIKKDNNKFYSNKKPSSWYIKRELIINLINIIIEKLKLAGFTVRISEKDLKKYNILNNYFPLPEVTIYW